MHAYRWIHTGSLTYIHRVSERERQGGSETDIHTDMQAVNTYIHACIHTSIHPDIHKCMHTYMHTYIHIYIHTNIQTRRGIQTYIYAISIQYYTSLSGGSREDSGRHVFVLGRCIGST